MLQLSNHRSRLSLRYITRTGCPRKTIFVRIFLQSWNGGVSSSFLHIRFPATLNVFGASRCPSETIDNSACFRGLLKYCLRKHIKFITLAKALGFTKQKQKTVMGAELSTFVTYCTIVLYESSITQRGGRGQNVMQKYSTNCFTTHARAR